MSEKKSNSRKRTAVTIILLLIALLLGIERCIHRKEPSAGKSETKEATAKDNSIQPPAPEATVQEDTGIYHHSKTRHRAPSPKTAETPYTEAETTTGEEKPRPHVATETTRKEPTVEIPADSVVETAIADIDLSPRHEFRIGIRAGAGYSAITSLGGMTESYNMRPQFTQDEKGGIVFRGGIFGTWRYGRLGAELGVDYMRLAGSVEKNTARLGLSEKTEISCDVISPQLMFRFYPFRNFYMSAGALLAIPFHTSTVYTANRTGTVYQQQDHLRALHLQESIKSRLHLMPSLKIGYVNAKTGIEAAVEYGYGATDLLRTIENDYGYTERTNNSHYFGVSMGYTIKLKD